jgi:transposase
MTMPSDDAMTEITPPARRLEVFTGAGRRRTWSAEDKTRIVMESYSGTETVCAVARRHGLMPTQLFTWRRAARSQPATDISAEQLFAPVVIERATSPKRSGHKRARTMSRGPGAAIELEIDGVTVRVGPGAESSTVAAVIRALKSAR